MGVLETRADKAVIDNDVNFGVLCGASALAWFYCIELNYLVFYTFRRYQGLYFYSILISAWGCTFHSLAWLTEYLTSIPNAVFLVLVEIGQNAILTKETAH